jgi:deoxyribonuclease V
VRPVISEPWPSTVAAAEAVQNRLRPLLDLDDPGPATIRTAAGLDVAYEADSDRVAAAVVVLDVATVEVVDVSVTITRSAFPYAPGFLAFREIPPLLDALAGISTVPDLLVCDGNGLAHPRRFGLASHLGVLTGLPSIGVAKTRFVGSYDPVGDRRGDRSALRDGDEVIGAVLRTRDRVKPVFVSVGNRMSLDNACAQTLRLCRDYRQPETTRQADHRVREALKGTQGVEKSTAL